MITKSLRALALLVVLTGMTSLRAQDEIDRELLLRPLPIRDQYLFNNGFYFFEPESALVPRDRGLEIDVRWTDANTFARSDQSVLHSLDAKNAFLILGEIERLSIAFRRSLTDDLQLGLVVPVSDVGGGWLDPVIEHFHNTFSLGDVGRLDLPQNAEIVYLSAGSKRFLQERSSGPALGDIAVTAKYELPQFSDNVTIALATALELPTGNERKLTGSGSIDGGLEMIVSRDFARGRFNASFGLLKLGPNRSLGTPPQSIMTGTASYSQLVSRASSVTAEITVSECPLRQSGISVLTRRSYQIAVGMQHRIGRFEAIHFGIIENLFNQQTSADLGIALGTSFHF